MSSTVLNASSRTQSLHEMADERGLDILVIGGGVTGAGIALDAAKRGLRVGIVEAQDWASGTSSRSSKLLHGGLRYLEMLDFALVHEAILERNRLLKTIAPHLSVPVPFIYPLTRPVVERAYVGAGVLLYDALAWLGARPAVPGHKHLSKQRMLEVFSGLKHDKFVGGIQYFDARIDDARLVATLVRTAVGYGALAATRTQVTSLTTDAEGSVTGAEVLDLESNTPLTIRASHVINATGVWTERTESLSGASGGLKVLASKGVHIVVPRPAIPGNRGIISRTEKSVLFVIPWQQYWIIGTTDTPWTEDLTHPVATKADVDYLLEHVNSILEHPINHEDIIGTYAGLRPLLQPEVKEGTASTKVSREHTVASPVKGLTVIAGGKLTTYRVMAEDAVDFAIGERAAATNPSSTANTPLVGARGLDTLVKKREEIGRIYGWDRFRVNRLVNRYGTSLYDLFEAIGEDPDLGKPLEHAPLYLRAEVRYAVTHEGALHIEDVLMHRTRLNYEQRDRGVSALREIADIMAPLLQWDAAAKRREIAAYRAKAAAEDAAEHESSDEAAEHARLVAADITPMKPSSREPSPVE